MQRPLFFIAMIFFVSSFAFSQAQDADDDFYSIDAYYLGRAVAANILTSYRIYNNAEATQYLNRICQTLVINSSNPAPYSGYYVAILDSNEFNAFSTPAGHIFITRKVIESVTSEEMLAAVIAHELAHIMLNHGIKMINEKKLENELSSIADWASSVAGRHSATAARAEDFRSSITTTVDVLMRSGFSQTQEFEADMEAIVLLAGAGYDPRALLDMLRILQQVQTAQRNGFYTTHPSPEQRIARLDGMRYRTNETARFRVQRFRNTRF
ncbi:MAG: M48 family metalloprotease [Treponema sp.]|nr:M48 family metalloprotease [Treponema sp.]